MCYAIWCVPNAGGSPSTGPGTPAGQESLHSLLTVEPWPTLVVVTQLAIYLVLSLFLLPDVGAFSLRGRAECSVEVLPSTMLPTRRSSARTLLRSLNVDIIVCLITFVARVAGTPVVIAPVVVAKIADPTVVRAEFSVADIVAAHIAVAVRGALGGTHRDALHADEPFARRPAVRRAGAQFNCRGCTIEHVQSCPSITTGLQVATTCKRVMLDFPRTMMAYVAMELERDTSQTGFDKYA